jgi:RNA 3'-terminal phosphate cyclase (ATP)
MITIDGSIGEGGGQVLRSALTLAVMTGQAMQIDQIRAGRSKPGLRAQHLKAVRAAAKVSQAWVEGDEMGSTSLVFKPGEIRRGNYRFDIGTAGSTSLVLQTVFLPLSMSGGASTVTIQGGTHVPWSPCFHYLSLNWLPVLRQIGFQAEMEMSAAGFYPQGGGNIQAKIHPVSQIKPLTLTVRGQLKQISGISAVANLDRHIAERQRNRVVHRLGSRYPLNDLRIQKLPARFKGTFLLLLAEFEDTRACYCALGAKGKRAETVADETIDALEVFMETEAAVDQYLADQLLLPWAFASGPSTLHTCEVTQHLVTNAVVIRAFTPVRIEIDGLLGEPGIVRVIPSDKEPTIHTN